MTSLTLFKTSPSVVSTSGNNRPGQPKTLATVSTDQPELEHASDWRKGLGLLKDGRASLRVELFKQSHCQAEFTCQVRGFGSQGNVVVTSTRLLQPQVQKVATPRETSMTPVVLTQILSSIPCKGRTFK